MIQAKQNCKLQIRYQVGKEGQATVQGMVVVRGYESSI